MLVSVFDEMFYKLEEASAAYKLLSGIKYFLPRLKGPDSLPRALHAAKVYSVRRPANQRLPLPWVATCAIVARMCSRNHVAMGVETILSHKCYLRPGEADRLKVKQLVRPCPAAGRQYLHWGLLLFPTEDLRPGKTKDFDESVLVDNCPFLSPFLEVLASNRSPESMLWPHSPEEYTKEFEAAVVALKLEPLKPCRYAMRHGGASEDLLLRRRSALEVKRRGRWRSDDSLKRYGKETRLLAELSKIPKMTMRIGEQASLALDAVLHQKLDLHIP